MQKLSLVQPVNKIIFSCCIANLQKSLHGFEFQFRHEVSGTESIKNESVDQ